MKRAEEDVLYKIGELAKRAEVSKRCIRYYEELGLLSPSKMSSGGFRLYQENDLWRLRVIKGFKEVGYSLERIKEVLHPKPEESKEKQLKYSTRVLSSQLDEINKRIEELKELGNQAEYALKKLDKCNECTKESCPPGCSNHHYFL